MHLRPRNVQTSGDNCENYRHRADFHRLTVVSPARVDLENQRTNYTRISCRRRLHLTVRKLVDLTESRESFPKKVIGPTKKTSVSSVFLQNSTMKFPNNCAREHQFVRCGGDIRPLEHLVGFCNRLCRTTAAAAAAAAKLLECR